MLFNKNEVRKASEKKVLHKSGKSWIVLSSALLLALAGGAAVSGQTSANADSSNNNTAASEQGFLNNVDNNSNITPSNNSTIHDLVHYDLVNNNRSAAPKSAQSASAKSSVASQWYWAANAANNNYQGGSAQKNYDMASADANNANKYNNIVKSYVSSVNAKFPTQTSSLNANLGQANSKLGNDKSLAASYSATANNSNYSSEVASLASKADMTYSAYVQSVGYNASINGSHVAAASNLNSEMNVVNSAVQEISDASANSGEYADKRAEAHASLTNAEAYLRNARANVNAYNSASAEAKTENFNEKIALQDSVADAGVVQSIANNVSDTSSVVSAEIHSLADKAGEIQTNTESYTNGDATASFEADHYITSEGADPVNGNMTDYNYYYLRGNDNANDHTVAFSAANGTHTSYVDQADANLVRVVFNTSVMDAYKANSAAYGRTTAQYASASAALNSAEVAVNDASASASLYDILGNHPDIANNLFGVAGEYNGLLKPSDYQDAYNFITGGHVVNNGTTTTYNYKDGLTASALKTDVDNAANGNSALQSALDAAFNVTPGSGQLALKSSIPSVISDMKNALNNYTNAQGNKILPVYQKLNNDPSLTVQDLINQGIVTDYGPLTDNLSTIFGAAKNSSDLATIKSELESEFPKNIVDAEFTNGNGSVDYKDANSNDEYNALINAANGNSAVVSAINGDFVPNTVSNGTTDVTGTLPDNASAYASDANSAASDYSNYSNASVAYNEENNADLVLAPEYAASYAGDIKGDQAAVNAASSAASDFYTEHAGSGYSDAAYQANQASEAEVNDNALAKAYGINVYNNAPKYITVIKNARVHSDTNFGSKGDRVLSSVPKGAEYTVEGIGLDAHGALRYQIYNKGSYAFVSGNSDYVIPTFLPAQNNISIIVNKPARVYKDANFTKYAGKTIPANTQLAVNVVREDNFNNGFTRIQLSNGDFITANTQYVAAVANNDNSNAGNENNDINTQAESATKYDNNATPIHFSNL